MPSSCTLRVVPGRLELPTSTLSVWRSDQLSYRTGFKCRGLTKDVHPQPLELSINTGNGRHGKREESMYPETSPGHHMQTDMKVTVIDNVNSNSRKEVFQPHLPVRLPCYDLAPITGFALGRSSRSRTSGAPGFHGLTGGVYKARERIHRAMADARLLANPASWGRVADPNPN